MKRILHVIDSVEPGGAENVFVDLITNLDREKYHPVVTIPGKGWLSDRLDQLNIEYYTIPATGRFNVEYLISLVSLIRKEQIDLIQSHLFGANVYSSLAGLIMFKPVVSVFHGAVDISTGESLLWLKSRIIEYGSNKVIAVSNSLREEVVSRTGIREGKVSTIYNGIDTVRFSPKPHNQLREKYNVPDGCALVVSIGYLRPPKGYELLLLAARCLIDQEVDVRFLIVGDGDMEYKDFLYAEHKKLSLESHVFFIGAANNPEYFLNGSDVFLLPSISEGFSISTIEAMSCGLPVIATKSGGPEEIISDRVDGMLVDVDAKDISESLSSIIAGGKIELMDKRAREKVKKTFSLLACVQSYQDIYKELLKV